MDAQRQKKVSKAQNTGLYNLIVPQKGQNKRKFIAARFPQGPPAFAQETCVLQFEGQPPSKQQKGEQQKEPSLLLSRRPQQGQSLVGPRQLQGVPRPDAASNYFVLSKGKGCSRDDFMVQPLDATFTFKQYNRTTALSIDEVEAQMRSAAGGGADPARLLPKSMRKQMQESAAAAAAEKKLQEDVAPLFDSAKVAELSVKYGGTTTQGKLVQGHSDDEEGSEEGWGEGPDGSTRKKGPAKDKKGAAKGAGKGKKGGKDAGDLEIPEDEVPEDIFAGEEDELRPAAPVEDADWEYIEDNADDDLYQGASDEEEQPDDPGMRKKLGLEEEEEEEEKKEPEEDKPEGEAAAAAGAAGAAAAAAVPSQASQGGSVESESVADDEEMIGEDVDLDRLAAEHDLSQQPAKRRKGSVGPPGRDRSPAPSRLATPPLGSTASAGGSRATPPLGANRRGSTPPLGSKAAAAAGSKKTPPPGAAPRRTPPPGSTAPKRKREDAAAAGAAVAAAGAAAAAAGAGGAAAGGGSLAAYRWRPEQLDAQGVPTVEGVSQALQQMGPIPTTQITLLNEHLDAVRVGEEGKKLLKQRILQVAKVEARNGVKVVILKGG